MTELAWFIIGADAAMLFALYMLFFSKTVRRRWHRQFHKNIPDEWNDWSTGP